MCFNLGKEMTQSWYNECNKYDYRNPSYQPGTGHFTQIVWKNTKYFGLGVCNISNGGLIFVANYYPRGNYKDQFVQNIAC